MTTHQKSLTASLEVCKCGHGKVHHETKFGQCSCRLTRQYQKYTYDICSCPEFRLDWLILNGNRITNEEYQVLLNNSYAENEEH